MRRRISLCVLASLLGAFLLSGCVAVKPWERDLHARADMQPSELDLAIDEHIYFSKEASSGGRGFGGGGCGCN
jgi:hypothetical protein